MRLARLGNWMERWAAAAGSPGALARAVLATLWAMLGVPLSWLLVIAMFGRNADSMLYGLALAAVLSIAGYAFTLSLFRRWSR